MAIVRCVLLIVLIAASPIARSATTYYVRSDGGDPRQCSGRVDAAHSSKTKNKACAWAHPFHALPPNGRARLSAGDTLIIGTGDYPIGWGAPGIVDDGRCQSSSRWDCYPAAIPSGIGPDAKTRILGRGYDSGCLAPPSLWGTERVEMVLNLEGSSNVEIGCLEITDHSDCVEFHVNTDVRCERDQAPYGRWGSTGLWAKDSREVWLHDLDIHGLANRGLLAGGLSDWRLERVKIVANGWAGWDGDVGKESSNSGEIVMRHVEIAWNGCGQRWQSGAIHGCWAQERGGYGDGLGTAKTGGRWLIEDAYIHHNTSDGLDLLYLDGAKNTSAVLRRVRAEGNAGNQIKTNGNATIENSIVVGNCAYFDGRDEMTSADQCRALGNAISIGLEDGNRVLVRHNTVIGEGDCLLLTSGSGTNGRVDVQNNALLGQLDWRANRQGNRGELACGHYADGGAGLVHFSNNLFWNVKGQQCPTGSVCNRNPKLTNMDMSRFDPTPLSDSPLVDRAIPLPGLSRDSLGQVRPLGPAADIGAIEAKHR